MKLLIYSTKNFEIPFLDSVNLARHKVSYTKEALDTNTVIQAMGFEAISIFSGDDASSAVLEKLWNMGVRQITLCSVRYIDQEKIKATKYFGFKVSHVPAY